MPTPFWDVDGTGIQRIKDADFAKKLKARVNSLNQSVALESTTIFAAYLITTELLQRFV